MIHTSQMHQLVDEHVLADRSRHEDETPVQTDVTIATARAPTRALVPDADARHHETVSGSEREQSWRKFTTGLLAQRAPLLDRVTVLRQSSTLPRNPFSMSRGERFGFATRAAAWNRYAKAAIRIDTQHVATGAAMPDEICGCNGFMGFMGFNRVWFKRKAQLHPMRE